MADITIRELETTTEASDSSYIPIDNGTKTQKITVANYNANANATAKHYAEEAEGYAGDAADSEASAESDALKAEGFATGKQNGIEQSSGTYYQNNAKYYKEQAALSAVSASTYANNASNSASSAATSAATATAQAQTVSEYIDQCNEAVEDSEAWAAGQRDGIDVGPDDPTYHNNAKYYATMANPSEALHVHYDNTESGMDADNVQEAIDENAGDISALEAQNGSEVLETTAQTLSGAINELSSGIESLDSRLDIVEDDINNVTDGIQVKIAANTSQIQTVSNNLSTEVSARQTADNNEASARAGADANLQSQIDQIIAPSGQAPSAAEVTNARIGADGVTYDTLGNAIRGQVGDLRNDVTSTLNQTVITKERLVQGSFSGAGGASTDARRIRLSIPIFVTRGTRLRVNVGNLYWMLWELSSTSLSGGNSMHNTGWSQNDGYTVVDDCYLMMAFATGSSWEASSNINVSDFGDNNVEIMVNHYTNNLLFNKTITKELLRNGGFSSTGAYDSNTRICMYKPIFVRAGSLLKFDIGSLYCYVFELSTPATNGGNIIDVSYWMQVETYVVRHDCWLMLSFATSDTDETSTPISISDFDGYSVQIIEDYVDNDPYTFDNRITVTLIEDGGFSGATGKGSNGKRIRLVKPLYLQKGTKLIFSTESLYHMIWELSSDATTGGNVIHNTSWIQNNEYRVQDTCYLMMAFATGATDDTSNLIRRDDFAGYSIQITDQQCSEYSSYLHDEDTTLQGKIETFSSLFTNGIHNDSFLFFTDSHFANYPNGDAMFESALLQMGAVYKQTPTDFCIFGGDAITGDTNSTTTTKEQAMTVLGKHDKLCRDTFGNDRYFPLLGNHDNNYLTDGGLLDQDEIINMWFRKEGKAYYSYKNNNANFYFLDTGMNHDYSTPPDYNVPMDSYKWQQIDWLANKLIEDDADHSVVTMHIIYNNNETYKVFCLFDYANQLCAAYNLHTTITLNGITYDFTGCTGKVELFLGGHMHGDQSFVRNEIPCVLRANTQNSGVVPTFDLVLCDWDDMKVHFVRIGNGNGLTINLA